MNSPNMPPTRLLLASESPYKTALLKKVLAEFDAIAPEINESPNAGESPYKLAERLADEKTAAVLNPTLTNTWILGCDQVAVLYHDESNYTLLNKPGSFERAREQLTACSGKKVTFYTACSLLNSDSNAVIHFSDTYHLHFRKLSDEQITRYLHREKPYDCAGSIKSEALGILLIERFEGSDPNTLIGLPLIKLIQQLEQLGFSLF